MVGDRCVELSCSKSNIFERARLQNKVLAIISDGDFLNTETIRLLKLLIGRDVVTFDIKHESVTRNFSFRYDGVVFVTSNQNISNAMIGSFDRAVLDRFFQIPFTFVPQNPQPGLESYLLKNVSALINWALYVDASVLQAQVRVGSFIKFALEDNPYIDFIVTSLTADPKGFISFSDIADLLDDHFKQNALPALTGNHRRRVGHLVLDLLKTVCGCDVGGKRNVNKQGIRGVRLSLKLLKFLIRNSLR